MFQKFKNISQKRKKAWLWNSLIGVGSFILILIVLANIDATPYNTFESPEYQLRIKYPAYWSMTESPEGGAVVVFVAPQQHQMDFFQENINVSIQPLRGSADLRRFTDMTVRQLTGTFKNYVEVVEGRDVRLAGRPAYRFAYETVGADSQKMKYLHVWTLRGPYAYIITYAARAHNFNDYKTELKKVLRSFEFL